MEMYDGRYRELGLHEVACKCGCGVNFISMELADKFMIARRLFGEGITITSGFRCINHNRSVGSQDTSSHTKGLALDVRPARDVNIIKFIRLGICLGSAFGRVLLPRQGIETQAIQSWFYHVDVDTDKTSRIGWY